MDEQPVERIMTRLAAHAVRRQCNQHECTAAVSMSTPCTHPNHRRDVHLLENCLAMLGLTDEPVITTADEHAHLLDTIKTLGPPPGVDIGTLLIASLKDR